LNQTRNFVAIDLGASSGRAVIGRFDGSHLELEEIHRFPNGPVPLPHHGKNEKGNIRCTGCPRPVQ
jgi:sugar (pentulose or hexulose) kinase